MKAWVKWFSLILALVSMSVPAFSSFLSPGYSLAVRWYSPHECLDHQRQYVGLRSVLARKTVTAN
jgi:hypothetical protein